MKYSIKKYIEKRSNRLTKIIKFRRFNDFGRSFDIHKQVILKYFETHVAEIHTYKEREI